MRIKNKKLLKNNNSKKIKKNTIFNNKGYILLTTSIIIFVVSTILSSLSAGFIFYNNLYHSSLKEDDSFKESEVNNLKKDVINFTYANYFDLLYMLKKDGKIEEIQKDEDNTETKEEYLVLDLLKDIDNYYYEFDSNDIESYFDLSGYNKDENPDEYDTQIISLIDQASSKIYDRSQASSVDVSNERLVPIIDNIRKGSYEVEKYFNDLNEDISISLYTKKLSFTGANRNLTSFDLGGNRIYYAYGDEIGVANLAHLLDFSIEIKNDSYRLTLNFTTNDIHDFKPDETKKIPYPFEYMKKPPTIEEGDEIINPDEGNEEEVTLYNQLIKLDLTIKSTLEKIN